MGRILATILVLALLTEQVQAHSNFAELLFGKSSLFGRHVDDEAFGDEFKRHKR